MGKDPGHVVTEVAVGLRHPRRRKDASFQSLVDRVYGAVAGRSLVDAAGEAAVPTGPFGPRLATARPNAVAGLVEKLKIDGGQVDLYRLAAELNYELDDLLPIVEAGELLGLVTVREGGLLLAPVGETYADATILARKELVAGRLLRLPVIRWVFETLQRHDDQRIARDFFLEELTSRYGDFAENQLDAVISWGRFAELFAFDDDTDELFLE
jgi:NitT/TauT family transport system ATP-binding protein